MWLSLVERCVRDAEVAGSNPVASTGTFGPLVKRLRRRPLTAETGVRFPYGLLRTTGDICLRFFHFYGELRDISYGNLKIMNYGQIVIFHVLFLMGKMVKYQYIIMGNL